MQEIGLRFANQWNNVERKQILPNKIFMVGQNHWQNRSAGLDLMWSSGLAGSFFQKF